MLLEIVFVIFSFSFAQVCSNDQFLQETVTVFTLDDGLPETVFSEIRLNEQKNIVAVSDEGEFIFDVDRWKNVTKSSSRLTEQKNNSHENILSKVKYLNQVYIGKKNGLFILNEIEDELIEIFPRDRNYSWKLSNVNVLHVDFKDRLWFGSDEGVGYYYNGQWKFGLVLRKGQSEQMGKNFTIVLVEDGYQMIM